MGHMLVVQMIPVNVFRHCKKNSVKNNRVYLIEQNTSSRSNENSIIAFENMAKALYPDLFTN